MVAEGSSWGGVASYEREEEGMGEVGTSEYREFMENAMKTMREMKGMEWRVGKGEVGGETEGAGNGGGGEVKGRVQVNGGERGSEEVGRGKKGGRRKG